MKHPKPGIDYDPSSVQSIVSYAMQLQGSTLRKALDIPADTVFERRGKGGFGESVEYYYFGYEPNSRRAPDFEEAGIELKVTPLKIVHDDQLVPKERLVITMINYMTVIDESFADSSFCHKTNSMLLMHYLHDEEISPFDYRFELVHLWALPKEDHSTIRADWEVIVGKIRSGRAHELSGSDTNYLEACTKSADSSRTRQQPYSAVPAKPRAFALKCSYVRTIVHNALSDQPIERASGQKELGLEQLVHERVRPYVGMSDLELCARFDVDPMMSPEARWVKLTYLMLGITNNRSSEFMKANISVRSIREEANGSVTESMSLAPFEFLDLASETWQRSELYSYLDETRFLFATYRSDGVSYRFSGAVFWNMPVTLLNGEVRKGWEAVRDVIRQGVSFERKRRGDGSHYFVNNLPKKRDNPIIHIRPHAKLSAYRTLGGQDVGNVLRDASELPDGRWMTRQSFWLNNNFLKELISSLDIP